MWVTSAWNNFGTYWNETAIEVPFAGSNRRLPCFAVENGDTASVPIGTGMENWDPSTAASWVASRSRSNASIAAREVAHSALESCAGTTSTTVSWMNKRMTSSVDIVATVEATPSESSRKGRVIDDSLAGVRELMKTMPWHNQQGLGLFGGPRRVVMRLLS